MKSPRDNLIAQVTSAWRPTDIRTGGAQGHPSFYDLDAAGREQAYRATCVLRTMEAALDPEGLTTTARAVLNRIRGDEPSS